MIQTMPKKHHFWHDLDTLSPNSGNQTFISKIWLRQSLDIMVSYDDVKYQKKLMIQS